MSPEKENTSILQLAENILQGTKEVAKHLQLSKVSLPSFQPTAEALPITPDLQRLQSDLRTQLEDLQLLIDGPTRYYRQFLMRGYEIGAFQVALDFDFFTLVPSKGDISVGDLASKAGLDEDRAGRIIRLLITHRFFQESRPGFFSHNLFSIALQRDDEIRSMVHYSFDEMLKAAAETSMAIRANPFEADSVHCPFFTRHGVPIFDYYKNYPEHAGRFAKAMAGWRKMTSNIIELRDDYPWAGLKGTVVDVGGGSGHTSIELARFFPHLNFNVQDGDYGMLVQGQRLLTDDVRDRISFTRANFFEPQQYIGAAAYLLRQCTHNWADHDVIVMLKALVPGLEGSPPGTPLLINDMILPEPGTEMSRLWERERRQADMVMLVSFGAKQRTVAEFEALLNQADTRYVVRKVHEREQGALGTLEVYLDHGGKMSNGIH